MSVAALASGASERRGTVAFHYATPLTPRQLAWYSRFAVLITHDPLPPAQVAQLHARGTKLVLYEWAVAFYASLANAWQKQLIADRRGLLHSYPLRGGLGSADADAWYYDPASREHVEERAGQLAQKLRAIGYEPTTPVEVGVGKFVDWYLSYYGAEDAPPQGELSRRD